MADIRPFQAIRYNEAKLEGSLASVVAPPYDVISVEDQEHLYHKSAHNCVRLILNREYDGDGPTDNRYTRAAKCYAEWLEQGVLVEDLRPAFYVYEQEFEVGGRPGEGRRTRRGVSVALKLEPFGTGCVLPHEETFPTYKKDRFQLMSACRANLSPVFGLVPDGDARLRETLAEMTASRNPVAEVTDDGGVVNRLWAVEEEAYCERLVSVFQGRKIYIADGHHRYETACSYREERWKNDSTPGVRRVRAYDYMLMTCVPLGDPGLLILPTHRLVKKLPGFSKDAFLGRASELFEVRAADAAELLAVPESTEGEVRFGVVFTDRDRRVLVARPAAAVALRQAAPERCDAWRGLDVSVLNELVLKGLLAAGAGPGSGRNGVVFTQDTRAVLEGVPGSAAYDLGFILRPTRIEQLCAVAEHGERMPHKSTYFHPKLPSGLVMRRL